MRSKINSAALFQKVEGYYKSLGPEKYSPTTQVISKSNLIATSQITAGTTNLSFFVNANNTAVTPQLWETRLQATDTFAFSRPGYFWLWLARFCNRPGYYISQ